MIKLFVVYGLLIVAVPAVALRPILRGKTLSQGYIICVVFSSFYYMNVVLVFGLLGLTQRIVMIGVTLLTVAIIIAVRWKRIRSVYFPKIKRGWETTVRIFKREVPLGLAIRQSVKRAGSRLKKADRMLRITRFENVLEIVILSFCILMTLVLFGYTYTQHYSYFASDIVTHQGWINTISSDNKIFGAGVYPFGMHAMVYYIHAVFDIPTVLLLRLLPPIHGFFSFMMVLAVAKQICRTRFAPYIGYFLYIGASFTLETKLARFLSMLPQEYGLIYCLPCLAAAVMFFRERKAEVAAEKALKDQDMYYVRRGKLRKRRESTLWLWLLIISFGLTMAVHFYVTILAGVLIVAIAVGYLPYIFRRQYFGRLVAAALIAVIIPVTPMAAAFASGTPLQGSLYWATSVMGIDLGEVLNEDTGNTADDEAAGDQTEEAENGGGMTEDGEEPDGSAAAAGEEVPQEQLSPSEKLKQAVVKLPNAARSFFQNYTFGADYFPYIVAAAILPLVCAFILLFFKEWEYVSIVVTVVVNLVITTFVSITGQLDLPVIIDPDRMSNFQCYEMPLIIAIAVDAPLVVLSRIIKKVKLTDIISFGLAAACIISCFAFGKVRGLMRAGESSLQSDEAAICLYEIMNRYPEKVWTIVSCNEERAMMDSTGWHYEVIDFLRDIEHYDNDTQMLIPTHYVFFFIEKESLNYAIGAWSSDIDPTVSEEWASMPLPPKSELSQYNGTNRIILNSRMYYWAQEFMLRYPNELKVFYENDEFVCYFLEQNDYYLYNLAIDYGFNEDNPNGNQI